MKKNLPPPPFQALIICILVVISAVCYMKVGELMP